MIGFRTTEKSVRLIEGENTLVVVVDKRYTKTEIQKKAEETLKVKVERVNVHVKDNKKYAYIKLKKEFPAIDVATKFGLI